MDAIQAFYPAADAGRNATVELAAGLRFSRRAKKRQTMHLLHVANAAEHLRRLPDDGETIHAVMKGNYHAWDLVPAVLQLATPATIAYLGIATLGFNRANAQELVDLLDKGHVSKVDFICSTYFRGNSADEYTQLHGALTSRGHRCVAIRSHAKVILFQMTDGAAYVIESSANLRSCRAIEQFTLTADPGLLAFHREWIEQLITEALK
jgi:hypothetical protein